ncbi:YceI family protein [Chitinophaga rhizophila]|uniref:YceI family protein n=1 Tax=Chitinophaga rhizophila TaxID=2866212 RepID=A0ABS7GKV6_9BACT|nr:YceI family protein [Chitinophaga rhizophila]MBW8687810.1 YceI family protein [Chitinophaga rhizophila]
MKKISIIASALLAFSASTFAQTTWSVDKAHARLGYSITHMTLSENEGNFKSYDAKIKATKPDFSDATFEVSIDVNSINTDNEMRDKHLKSADFFDAEKYPTITFKSTSFKKVNGNQYKLTGDLTFHGVTKQVILNAVYNGTQENAQSKKMVAGFTISGSFKRKDFGFATEAPATMLGEDVKLRASGEFVKE